MKLSKKFITAIGMLTLSAVMLTTSSFAWFSVNEKVEATGMQVTAKGDQIFLQISNGAKVYDADGKLTTEADSNSMFSDKVSMLDAVAKNSGLDGEDPIKYLPVAAGSSVTDPTVVDGAVTVPGSVADLAATSANSIKWYTNSSSTTESSAATGAYRQLEVNNDSDLANYCLVNTFYIRLNPAAGGTSADQPLTAKPSLVGAPTDDMAKAVSVLIVCGNYAQVWKQDASVNDWKLDGGDSQLTASGFANSTTGEEVKVYIYFDGENANCKTANIPNSGSYSVKINFSVVADPATQPKFS